MTNEIDATVNGSGFVRVRISDKCSGDFHEVIFDEITDAKTFHKILGFQIERADRNCHDKN